MGQPHSKRKIGTELLKRTVNQNRLPSQFRLRGCGSCEAKTRDSKHQNQGCIRGLRGKVATGSWEPQPKGQPQPGRLHQTSHGNHPDSWSPGLPGPIIVKGQARIKQQDRNGDAHPRQDKGDEVDLNDPQSVPRPKLFGSMPFLFG